MLMESMGNVQCKRPTACVRKLISSTLSTSTVYPDGSRPDMVGRLLFSSELANISVPAR